MKRGVLANILLAMLLLQATIPLVSAAPASITIDSSATTVTADGALRFSATVSDSSGTVLDEEVTWTCSSGLIDSTGLFTPAEAGQVNITATSGAISSVSIITVTPGWPVSIVSDFNQTEFSIDHPVNLTAHLADRAGNIVAGDVTWRAQNGVIDHQNQTWKPGKIGNTTLRAIWLELETPIDVQIVAGAPAYLEIPYGLTVQSGSVLHIIPTAYDSHGNEVELSKVGAITWSLENGTISSDGIMSGGEPGLWNLTATTMVGANGSGVVRVLPAQATGLSIELNNSDVRAGSPVILSAIRADVLGNNGEILLPVSNWTVPTGSLASNGENVVWVPSRIGTWTLAVNDQGYSATIEVEVRQGIISGLSIDLSEDLVRSGDSIVSSLSAYDSAGNHRIVSGEWTISEQLGSVPHDGWVVLNPGPIGNHSISAIWFDNESGSVHSIEEQIFVHPGELARIILPETGTKVPSDGVLDLNPTFEDEFGNILPPIYINWEIDGEDTTMELRISQGLWTPTKLGMHEIRAMGEGVFSIVEVEVIPGTARHVITNSDSGLTITSGKAVELEVATLDVHSNIAPADSVEFIFEDPLGQVTPSPTGDGLWLVEGGQSGEWNLRINAGIATKDITVVVEPGEVVRLISELPQQNPEEGSKLILRVYGVDEAGNRVEIPNEELTIECTIGDSTHLTGDTYEVDVGESGKSQSCNVYWEGLVAQKFFDVDAVLFGGGLGDTNSALTLVMIIVFLFLAIMVVLIRRMGGREETGYWDDDEDYEDDDDNEDDNTDSDLKIADSVPEVKSEPVVEDVKEIEESSEQIRTRLAEEAKRTGVMQAAPGTEQGKTGWYIDTSGELTSWQVTESGEWIRLS